MRPVAIEIRRSIPGPRYVVWRLLTDWERQGDWMLEASGFVVTTPHREGLGVECEATIRVAGIRTRDRVRVVGWEPERHLAIEHLGWVEGRGEIWLSDDANATALRWREELRPPWGVLGGAGLRMFRPLLARIFRRDLDVLARLAADAT
jgi:hypothetical protein